MGNIPGLKPTEVVSLPKRQGVLPCTSDLTNLSLEERRRLLAEQAKGMADYYRQNIEEREEWQSGDFIDEY